MHREPGHHADVRIDCVTDRNTFLAKDAVVIVDPVLCFCGVDECEGKRTDPKPGCKLDRFAVRAGDPYRWMRPLHGLGHDIAAGHLEIFALESRIGIHGEHVQTLLQTFAPHLALLFDRHPETTQLQKRRRFAGAEFHAAARHEIQRGYAFGDTRGMIVARRHQHDSMTEPDLFCTLRTRGQEHFGRGGMRIFLEEMMFDFPGMVDTQPVSEFNLVERILKKFQLVAFIPGPRQLMLVENAEFHRALLLRWLRYHWQERSPLLHRFQDRALGGRIERGADGLVARFHEIAHREMSKNIQLAGLYCLNHPRAHNFGIDSVQHILDRFALEEYKRICQRSG